MKKPLYNIGEIVYYYNKWSNDIEKGEITSIRQSNLNWDYKIRYEIYNNMNYIHWIQEDHIGRDKKVIIKYLN